MQSEGSPKRPSVFESAADQANYRVPDKSIVSCLGHGDAAVLCVTSGKIGRRGCTAAVGSTVFWLTCPYLNNIVARFERHGAVAALQKLILEDRAVSMAHVASHSFYENRVRELLDKEQWEFFYKHFVSGAANSSGARRYGNAAVSHATDLKCLHALVAQTMCGAPNPIGDAIVQFIFFLSDEVDILQRNQCPTPTPGADVRNGGDTTKIPLDELSVLVKFVKDWIHKSVSDENRGLRVPVSGDELCSSACKVVTFLEGRPPRRRRKCRIN
ncbi:putative Protein of unknown function (DUF501) [Trypanosoma vivax]|uniref:Uncharacterized protein n=1 Tax=Trypanosoma vivax (strain Y486) TaxID=1055687 RepID=G0TTX7_TRYVY|nr:hypothetical protein TRVL_02092 [Trypanosoma vivax]KAH8614035.1 putative Protein of unknown function (DUF501) [Trypanosoma vivax]CCC47410.1 conserved hypothetical protein [Trypanosoma vivax Y486]